MAICQRHKVRQQLHNTPDQEKKSTPSAYIHGSLDTGHVKHTDISYDGFNVIPMVSPGTVPPFSAVTPPSVSFRGLPRAFDRGRLFVNKPIYVTENHVDAKLELQAASTVYDFDIDAIQKINGVRFLQFLEPSGSYEDFQETDSSATGDSNAGVSNADDDDDDAVLHARNIESYCTAQLDPDGLEDAHYGP